MLYMYLIAQGAREDVSTESGVTVSDESSLLMEARPSPVDLGRQKEIISTLVKLLQVNVPYHFYFHRSLLQVFARY